MAAMLCDIIFYATSHIDHEKRVAWVSISMYACGSVPIVMVLHLVALPVANALLKDVIDLILHTQLT